MDKLYSPKTVMKLIKDHDFTFAKSLGQNFLIDGNIVDKIVASAEIKPDDLVIEIGTGLGVLTKAIVATGARVLTVEIDKRLYPILEKSLEGLENVSLIKGDFLKLDLKNLIDENKLPKSKPRVKVIGNLPYYISSPIIMKILEENHRDDLNIESLTIMVQKELGERMLAKPASKDYGLLSIAIQYYTEAFHVSLVPKTVFIPKPKVDSIVLRLEVLRDLPFPQVPRETFFKVAKKAFEQRRKTLLNGLTGINGHSKEELARLLESININGERRPETLSLEEFAAISELF